MDVNLLHEGIKFMILGMSTVFLFLTVLMFMIHFISFIIRRFFPEQKKVLVSTANVSKIDNKKIAAAITAAVMQYRKERR
jgi:oxaloacetate decarboxylase gamma subunit